MKHSLVITEFEPMKKYNDIDYVPVQVNNLDSCITPNHTAVHSMGKENTTIMAHGTYTLVNETVPKNKDLNCLLWCRSVTPVNLGDCYEFNASLC